MFWLPWSNQFAFSEQTGQKIYHGFIYDNVINHNLKRVLPIFVCLRGVSTTKAR